MRIFIDVGAHGGEIAVAHYEKHGWDRYILIEPHPKFRGYLMDACKAIGNCDLMEAAASDTDGHIDFFPCGRGSTGSTMLHGKTSGYVDYDNPVRVKCFDFSRWLRQLIGDNKSAKLGMSMDIEGGEYVVLPKIFDILHLFDELNIEFHSKKFKGVPKIWETHLELREQFAALNTDNWNLWHL